MEQLQRDVPVRVILGTTLQKSDSLPLLILYKFLDLPITKAARESLKNQFKHILDIDMAPSVVLYTFL